MRVELPENIHLDLALPEREVRVVAHERLPNVFWNLFDNARKAMPQGGKLQIRVDTDVEPGWAVVHIQDSGHGIEPWRIDSIFEPGEATPNDSYAPAHGLGLWWTRAQVESFGGTIAITSTLGAGTQVTLRLRRMND
jgi:signal transduction histidine kinase